MSFKQAANADSELKVFPVRQPLRAPRHGEKTPAGRYRDTAEVSLWSADRTPHRGMRRGDAGTQVAVIENQNRRVLHLNRRVLLRYDFRHHAR